MSRYDPHSPKGESTEHATCPAGNTSLPGSSPAAFDGARDGVQGGEGVGERLQVTAEKTD